TVGGISVDTLINDIAGEIKRNSGEDVNPAFSQPSHIDPDKLTKLKELINDLHKGIEFREVKKRFNQLMTEIEPSEIAVMEEELIREGMPATEIQHLCDLHVSVFKEALEKHEEVTALPGHPVHTYMAENEVFSDVVSTFDALVAKLSGNPSPEAFHATRRDFEDVIPKLDRIKIHYIRKENQLFPFLEKHGITGPPKVMWGIHDEVRVLLKEIRKAIEDGNTTIITNSGPKLSRTIIEMIYKENTILFPMAMDTLTDEEWMDVKRGEDEIGYAFVTPGTVWKIETVASISKKESSSVRDNEIMERMQLDTGSLTYEEVNLMLKHLPVEISFVDEQDKVRYYSETKERIFPRSPGVIGRSVQNCHPQKSVHIVNRILDAFRTGAKDSAEFWIEMQGKFILIRYYAVRDIEGHYKGTIEVTQDITHIRRLEGEQRLLDWDNEYK
ncbi:MAG TPA: DUF438 domain-containing protein, partial [Anaerolineae bacterium]|nr:DUF438 domain-containing protein [Anaerolineae bacterium]